MAITGVFSCKFYAHSISCHFGKDKIKIIFKDNIFSPFVISSRN